MSASDPIPSDATPDAAEPAPASTPAPDARREPGYPRPWPRHASERQESMLLFRPRWDLCENPRNARRLKRLVLEMATWCNIVARTPEGRFVLVRQWRFGTERVTLEIPGGLVDPGEEPLAAAVRELREETGFTAERWTSLGSVEPNPAFQDNRCHHFLAEGATRTDELELDEGEDIQVVLQDEAELRASILSGECDHALALSALMRVLDLRDCAGAPHA